ncbi:Predicted dithiol-disulfide oxidoreductase, DUF899 family [Fodinibius roseus]|uniref:Predicted dithiol-disulfide oxidoreductase, DUF899 family n=1 Tax=Fodinibius roseus TaxID=1194090 RepID=A0A1M5M666_9BACT|nr:DUF899 domain-containing protein [Fodinibius roseus]SHG72735.1 Predicted dithiol-disulfide oxidoreductase, DUF899 family [Fodinibius roseus]
MSDNKYSFPEIVSREEWTAERKELLKEEKEFTRQRDRLSAKRRKLPMVKIEKEYEFEGPDGKVSLLDLFEDRMQLIVYHFMFDPDWEEGCPSCSAWADQIARGHLNHLHARSTTLALVSRAPLAKISVFKKRMRWEIPWYSSYGSDFNYDFHVTQNESVKPVMYNYRDKATLEHLGQHYHIEGEQPGISCFLRIGDTVYHTYSTYGRGGEQVGGAHYFLDMTALGRQEDWEEPEGRATGLGAPAGSDKILYPDEYDGH